MLTKFGWYYRASRFLIERTWPKIDLFNRIPIKVPFGWLNLQRMHEIKKYLVSEFTESELRTLKSVINSQMESKKSFGPNNILITVFITGVFTFMISFFISYISFVGQIYTMSLKGEIKDTIILNEIEEINTNSTESKLKEFLSKLFFRNMEGYYSLFFIVFAIIIVYIIWYKFSFMRLVKLDNIVTQSIEEKKNCNKYIID